MLGSSTAMAQEREHSLGPDANALQFRISPNFTLSSFDGAVVSYKRHITADRARRMGISLSSNFEESDFPDRATNPTTENFDFFIDANYTFMRYIDPDAVIKVFYGYGPGLTFGFDRNKSSDDNQEVINKDRIIGLEGLAYAGVEWFFHPSVSIHAEYGASLGLQFRRQSDRQEILGTGNVNEDEINTTLLNLRSRPVLFGISVYF